MMLWNAVVPMVFVGGRVIDYWHALGLLVLCRILFGGFRGRGGWGGRRWLQLEAMTPGEREQLRQSYAARCGRSEGRTLALQCQPANGSPASSIRGSI